jgi:hypothetical protein
MDSCSLIVEMILMKVIPRNGADMRVRSRMRIEYFPLHLERMDTWSTYDGCSD